MARPRKPLTQAQRIEILERQIRFLAQAMKLDLGMESVFLPMDDQKAIPTPVSAQEIALRTQPHHSIAKHAQIIVYEREGEAEMPLPAETQMDHLPEDEVEGLTDDDGPAE